MKYLTFPAILISLTGCGVLQPVKDNAVDHILTPLVSEQMLKKQRPALAIKRPSLPSYLDRQQLVTRSNNSLMIRKADIWAEPLDVGISRVVASNLSRLTSSMNIQAVENFSSLDYSHLLDIRILKFEPTHTNQMLLEGTWRLESVTGKIDRTHYFSITPPVALSPNSMSANIDAMNQALEQLSQQIASNL